MDFCTGDSRAGQKCIKLDLNGRRDKTRLTREKHEGTRPIFEGQCAVSVAVRDGNPCSSKDKRFIDMLKTTEAPESSQVGIRASPLQKVVGSTAQLKYLYTNANSMGNKQEEMEATA